MHHDNNSTALFVEPSVRDYSPLAFGLAATMFVVLPLLLWPIFSEVALCPWIWLVPSGLILTGVLLQIFTRRLLYIRIFQLCGNLVILIGMLGLASALTANAATFVRTIILILAVLSPSIVHGYREANRKCSGSVAGDTGKLDVISGLLDPHAPSGNKEFNQPVGFFDRYVIKLTPLIAGIVMFIANLESINGINVLGWICVFAGSWASAFSIGRFAYFVTVTIIWEEDHEKLIFVDWTRPGRR
jgi:hypothetical protein